MAPIPTSWGCIFDKKDGDDRDDGLRERGSNGGQDAANDALMESEAVSQQFDAIGKHNAGEQDSEKTDREHDDVNKHESIPPFS